MTDDEARIKARYPQRSALDYVLGIGATIAVIAACALVLFNGLERANPPVAAMVRGFKVVSPQETIAEIVVQRNDPAITVECSLFAQAATFERVAEVTVKVPPGTDVLTSVDVKLSTIKEATTVTMEEPACRVAG